MNRIPTLIALVGALLVPLTASATDMDHTNHIGGLRFDAHAVFGGYGSLGAGLRIDIPIIRSGLINGVNDELALSPGIDVFFSDLFPDYYDGGLYVIPSLVAQWNFYLGDHWSVFPEAGVALYAGNRAFLRRGTTGFYVTPDFGLGIRYHFNSRNALLARVSTPTGFQLGLTF